METMTKQQDKLNERERAQDIFYHGVFNLPETPKENPTDASNTDEPKKLSMDDKMEILRTEFEKTRLYWRDKISVMSPMLKEMHKLADLSVDMYSSRQIVLEQSHFLQSMLAKVNSTYKKSVNAKSIELMNGDRKFKAGETKTLVETASMLDMKERIDLIESQINYMHETIKTLDNIGYGIGNMIKIEDYRRTT